MLNAAVQPKDIWLAKFPFEDDPTRTKVRPTGVILKLGEELVIVMITTKGPSFRYQDVKIKHLAYSNLPTQCYARCTRIVKFTDEVELIKKIGELHEEDYGNICCKLAELQIKHKLNYTDI